MSTPPPSARSDSQDRDQTLPHSPAQPAEQATVAPAAAQSSSDGSPVAANGVRFRRLREHARGGLGEVFVALDEELNREVALKEIQERFADLDDARTRFLREAEITGKLEHPGVVPVYGMGAYADGRPFYAMRFIRGESMEEAIARFHKADEDPRRDPGERSLALRELLGRFVAVCNALAYAHSKGIIHRDLKPANAMLGEYGETLVVDWGLAKVVDEASRGRQSPEQQASRGRQSSEQQASRGRQSLEEQASCLDMPAPPGAIVPGSPGPTQAGSVLGTPAYMPPEQASGRQDQVGTASDVFALGATLYCLLTGQPPYSGVDALIQAAMAEYVPARQRKRSAPAALEAVCGKAMAAKPEERYASARDVAEEVQRFLADEPVKAHAEPWHTRLGRWVRHHRGLVGSVAAIVAIGLTVAVAGWWVREASDRQAKERELRGIAEDERGEAEKQRKRADRYLYFSRISLADRAWQEADITRMDELLEQTKPQFTGGEDLRSFERDYLMRLRQSSLWTLEGHTGDVYSVAFSPDGQRLASASQDGTVKVWDTRTGRESLTHKGLAGPVTSVAFSPDGQRLASAGNDGTVKVRDARTGQESLTLKGHTGDVYSVAFSPDGKRLASASWDQTVKVWDTRTGKESVTLKGHNGTVNSLAFSPDGQHLACTDGSVKVWDLRTGQEKFALKGHTAHVWSVAFSPDSKRLASGSNDGTVKVWDARTGKESLTLKGHTNSVSSLVFSPDGQRLASGSMDQTVKIWDARTGKESLTLKGHTSFVHSVAFSPDGQRLASASLDGMVKVWDAHTDQESLTLKGHTSFVHSVAFSPDGQRLASASFDRTVKVWDARTGQESLTLKGHKNAINSVAFSPDGERLASASSDRTVKVWDARTGQESLTLKGHTNDVRSVAFSADGERLASASSDQTVKVWDARTGLEALILKGHTGIVYSVAFSPDGQRLASASSDQTVKVWDAHTGKVSLTLKGHANQVHSVVFSPDGQHLASASYDQTVKVWDATTGQESLTLKGHTYYVNSVAFSPDGQRLASAGQDGTVKLWDARTGQEALTLKGHTNRPAFEGVNCVSFSPDGRRLASCSNDGTVKVWDATPVNEASDLQRQAISYFRFVAETVVPKDDMIQQIRQTPTLSEPARELALAFAKDYREDAFRLVQVSWLVVRGSWASPGSYPLALRQAEAACRQEPGNVLFLNTLGAAQYRNRQYAAALKTLTSRDKRFGDFFKHFPRVLAFLAMTQFQLGQKAEAAATLGRLRDEMKKRPFDPEAEELLKEAESVVEAKK